MNQIQIGYLTGIIDGEGCVYVNRRKVAGRRKTPGYSVKVVVSITDYSLVEWFSKHAKLTSICTYQPQGNRKRKWVCTWNNSKAEWLLNSILPYLVIKKRQAVLGLELLKHLRTTPIVRGKEISKEVVEYREDIKQQISKLNFRGLPKH
jgi:hypothetical protein